jgi:hypothetical protein
MIKMVDIKNQYRLVNPKGFLFSIIEDRIHGTNIFERILWIGYFGFLNHVSISVDVENDNEKSLLMPSSREREFLIRLGYGSGYSLSSSRKVWSDYFKLAAFYSPVFDAVELMKKTGEIDYKGLVKDGFSISSVALILLVELKNIIDYSHESLIDHKQLVVDFNKIFDNLSFMLKDFFGSSDGKVKVSFSNGQYITLGDLKTTLEKNGFK